MKLRTSFVLSLVLVVWVVTCVFATLTTHNNRPCVVVPVSDLPEGCTPQGCHYYDPDTTDPVPPAGFYFLRANGLSYRHCGETEYYLDCVEEDPEEPRCLNWHRYDSMDACLEGSPHPYHTTHTEGPSCTKQL